MAEVDDRPPHGRETAPHTSPLRPLLGRIRNLWLSMSHSGSDHRPPLVQHKHPVIDGEFMRLAAAEIYAMRRRRDKYLPASLVGEPAWDILLAAFLTFPETMSASALAEASASPSSTGARWVDVLEKDGLLECCSSGLRDEPQAQYRLTDHGRAALEQALGAMLRD